MENSKQARPETLSGSTYKIETNAGNLYLTINESEGEPFEIFVKVGKAGSDVGALCEAIARMVSLCLRYQIPRSEIIKQLEGIGGDSAITPTVPHAIALRLQGAPASVGA